MHKTAHVAENIYRIINMICLDLTSKLCSDIRPWILSVPQSFALLLRTDNVHRQLSSHIFVPNEDLFICVNYKIEFMWVCYN